jgi:hypothetical protein
MSLMGQSRHFDGLPMTSGFPPEMDIVTAVGMSQKCH